MRSVTLVEGVMASNKRLTAGVYMEVVVAYRFRSLAQRAVPRRTEIVRRQAVREMKMEESRETFQNDLCPNGVRRPRQAEPGEMTTQYSADALRHEAAPACRWSVDSCLPPPWQLCDTNSPAWLSPEL